MAYPWIRNAKAMVLRPSFEGLRPYMPLLLFLALAIGCGAAVTPAPGTTTAPGATSAAAGTAVPAAKPAATVGPAGGKPKVSKLIMALTTPGWETNLV